MTSLPRQILHIHELLLHHHVAHQAQVLLLHPNAEPRTRCNSGGYVTVYTQFWVVGAPQTAQLGWSHDLTNTVLGRCTLDGLTNTVLGGTMTSLG